MIKKHRTLTRLLSVLFTLWLMITCVTTLDRMQHTLNEEGSLRLEDAVKRAANTCFSMEGFYPATLNYLTDNYGVVIDNEKYHIFYETMGANIQPEIKVYRR